MSGTYTWTEPKTDWYGFTDGNGVYTGDRFNSEDYNRIKNNINYLHFIAEAVYPDFPITDMGEDKSKNEYPYADEINAIENNLETISQNTVGIDCGESQTFVPQGKIFDYVELNRIESATLSLYNKLINQYDGRRMFQFLFGTNGGI